MQTWELALRPFTNPLVISASYQGWVAASPCN
jgi:hypothetical protein